MRVLDGVFLKYILSLRLLMNSKVRHVLGFVLSLSQSFGLIIVPLLQGLHGPVAQGSRKQNRPSRSWETWDSMKSVKCMGRFTVCFFLKCTLRVEKRTFVD